MPPVAPICRKPIGLYVPKTHWLVYAENKVAPMCRKQIGLYVVKSDTALRAADQGEFDDLIAFARS